MMKEHKIRTASIVAMLLLLIVIALPHSTAADDSVYNDGTEDIVEAVKASPNVQADISSIRRRIKSKESTQAEIKIISLGSGCGVVGCGASYLAVITVHRRGTNPQSASVLAMVQRSPKGVLGRVSVVELKEKGLGETKPEVQRRYSSPLPVIERK